MGRMSPCSAEHHLCASAPLRPLREITDGWGWGRCLEVGSRRGRREREGWLGVGGSVRCHPPHSTSNIAHQSAAAWRTRMISMPSAKGSKNISIFGKPATFHFLIVLSRACRDPAAGAILGLCASLLNVVSAATANLAAVSASASALSHRT